MDKNKKTILLVSGVVAVAAAVGLLVFESQRKKDESDNLVAPVIQEDDTAGALSVERQGKLLNSIAETGLCKFSEDGEAFDKALKDESLETCACIKNDNLRENCQKSLLEIGLYKQAIKQYDLNICNQISSEGKRAACVSVVQSGIDSAKTENPDKLGEVYSLNNNYDGAIGVYEELVVKDDENVDNLLSLALSYAGKGLSEQEKGGSQASYTTKALEYVEKAIGLQPENSKVYQVQGYVYEIIPDYLKSIESYDKAIELDQNNVRAYVGRGHAKELQGILEGALEDYKKAAELDVDNIEMMIYANLCRMESSRSDLYEDAIENCQIVLELPDEIGFYKSEAHQILATMYMRHDRLDEALIQLNLAMTYNPNDSNLYVTLGELYTQKAADSTGVEYLEKAEMYAKKATEITPAKAKAYAVLAYAIYKQGEGRLDEALKIAEKGLKLVDSDVSLLAGNKENTRKNLYWTLANIYNLKGDKENENKYLNLINEEK